MHLRLFSKNLFFCVIVLFISIHATSSIAESSGRLSKTTSSIFNMFTKAVVIGFALGCNVQILASSFYHKQRHSLNKCQEQQNSSSVCVPNSDYIFYVGQNNLTRCLEQNPQGTFIFVERVNFTQFSEDEKNKYPLYNNTVPFSGSLTMFPYSFDHFNITRSISAAMFFTIKNAVIRANLTRPDITAVNAPIGNAALVTIGSVGHNTLKIELDSASVKAFNTFGTAGGIIAFFAKNSINNISVRVKDSLNVCASYQTAGGFIGRTGVNSSLELNATINTMTVEFNTYGLYAGIIGKVYKNSRIKVNLKGSLIHIIDNDSMNGYNKRLSALYDEIHENIKQISHNIQIDHVIIEGGIDSTENVIYAGLVSQPVNNKTTLIRGMRVNIQAAGLNAIGIGEVQPNIRKISPVYLLSINGTLKSPNHILAPQGVSCEGSMIDWSGVHFNINNLGCDDALELETLRPEHWREAHRLVAIELCKDQKNCFYVSEELLALVKERDHSFFLVTRQRYPYNNANDGQGVVRVMQYILNNSQYNPTINASFAIDGTRLFTNATKVLLPLERPLSASLTNDHQLLMLYGETGNLKVASMPLMGMNDATYTIHTVQSSGASVQIDKDILWLNQDGDLLAYNVSDVSTEIFSRNAILSNSVHLIGAQRYQDYVYTAQLENDTSIFMTRFFNDGRQDTNWTSYFSRPKDYNIRQLHIEGDTNEPIISFPKVSELFHPDFLNDFYLTIETPSEGGPGKWRYGNESFIQMLLPATEPPTIMNTTDGNDAIGNMTTTKTITPVDIINSTNLHPNNNGGNTEDTIAAGILMPIFLIGSSVTAAAVTVILNVCHEKKVPCFINLKKKLMPYFKKYCVGCKKSGSSDLWPFYLDD